MITRFQLGPERLADHFITYLFENYPNSRHVRRVAFWVGLIVLAIDRIGDERGLWHKRQLRFTCYNRAFKVRYNHKIPKRGGIEIVEILPAQGNPDGKTVIALASLTEAEIFYQDAELILRQFVNP